MKPSSKDHLSLKGEVLEILEQENSIRIKIVCKPDWIILDLHNAAGFHLQDKVRIDGKLKVKKIYKLEPEENKISHT